MNSINIIKRNSATIPVSLYLKGEPVRLGGDDFLVFTVRKKIEDENYVIRKEVRAANFKEELGYYTIDILPEDTDSIELTDYNDVKYLRYDVTFYNSKNSNIEKTIQRGDFVVSWRASKEGDS